MEMEQVVMTNEHAIQLFPETESLTQLPGPNTQLTPPATSPQGLLVLVWMMKLEMIAKKSFENT
jgi:hypothetical protein